MLKRGVLNFAVILSVSNVALAQEAPQELKAQGELHKACIEQTEFFDFEKSIEAELFRHLGTWQSCSVETYNETEFGLETLIIAAWDNVKLSIEYKPPESATFTVEVTGGNPLPSDWYENSREKLVDGFFDMNWERDEFPGPRSEYYVSPEIGTNAQFWAERDKDGNITWMRFSYAL